MEKLSENKSFGGMQGVFRHDSEICKCPMTFGLYLPPAVFERKIPVLWYLSGLTCTHENAMTKAGAQKWAAKYSIALIFPDTSPRGEKVADDSAYDLGQGAGFYVDASKMPWAAHYKMWSYIADELPTLVFKEFALDNKKQAITGHSMGGHGALTLAMAYPGRFKSVSAFAPISHPSESEWGQKQFNAYFDKKDQWTRHDATVQMRKKGVAAPVLIDQGADDVFWDALKPEALAEAMAQRRQNGIFRIQKGYDHSYFFVSTFIGDHMRFHADHLGC